MTIEQIANTIDKNNWAFSILQTKPKFKNLITHAFNQDDTAKCIKELISKNKSEEIQITPAMKTGEKFEEGFEKTITINFKKNEMENNKQFEALAGLSGMGLNMSEIFTAKDKAQEVIDLKAKVERLEVENKTLESTNKDLGFDLKLEKSKSEKKNDFVELLKSPQGITLVSALASKFSPVPALGNAAPQIEQEQNEKVKWLLNYFNEAETPEMIKDFMIYIAKAQQNENAQIIMKEIAEILTVYNIIPSDKTA